MPISTSSSSTEGDDSSPLAILRDGSGVTAGLSGKSSGGGGGTTTIQLGGGLTATIVSAGGASEEERKYRCEVEGCRRNYKNSQGLR